MDYHAGHSQVTPFLLDCMESDLPSESANEYEPRMQDEAKLLKIWVFGFARQMSMKYLKK